MYTSNSYCLGEEHSADEYIFILHTDYFKQVYVIWLGTQQMRPPFSNISIHGDQNSHQPDQQLSNAKTEHLDH